MIQPHKMQQLKDNNFVLLKITSKLHKLEKQLSKNEKAKLPALQWQFLCYCHPHEPWYWHHYKTGARSLAAVEVPDNTVPQNMFLPEKNPHKE